MRNVANMISKRTYYLRELRARKANNWIKETREYIEMQKVCDSPNPISRSTRDTVIKYYVEKDSDNADEARKRCMWKYGWKWTDALGFVN